ncbi:hypothetical protein CDZ97_10225 [Mameliella alba]|nr:hypothetical protein CDZ97_10225 [Mameliella alba]
MCRIGLDPTLRGRSSSRSAVVDHLRPWRLRPDLVDDPANLQLICRGCHAKCDAIEKRLWPDADAIAAEKLSGEGGKIPPSANNRKPAAPAFGDFFLVDLKFDLLGDPIPDGRGEPGRTGHVPTAENARKIRALLVAGMKNQQIAKEIGISVPTLRKHYFQNGKIKARLAREMAIAEMRARNILRLDAQADKGNVSAMRALEPLLEKAERELIERDLGEADKPQEQSLGRKREREMAGFEADDELDRELSQEAGSRVH